MIFNYSSLIIRDQEETENLSKYFGYRFKYIVLEINNILINVTQSSFTGNPLLQTNKNNSVMIIKINQICPYS